MATISISYSSVQSMTVTNLNGLTSSATTGWQSNVVDNTANLYDDIALQIVLDFANTAPANSKGVYVYAYSGLETTYTNPASGSEGTITLLDVTTNAQALTYVGFIPYTTTDEVVESQVFHLAQAFGGAVPPKWGVVLVNHSGAAIASSGNSVKWRGVKYTVA